MRSKLFIPSDNKTLKSNYETTAYMVIEVTGVTRLTYAKTSMNMTRRDDVCVSGEHHHIQSILANCMRFYN